MYSTDPLDLHRCWLGWGSIPLSFRTTHIKHHHFTNFWPFSSKLMTISTMTIFAHFHPIITTCNDISHINIRNSPLICVLALVVVEMGSGSCCVHGLQHYAIIGNARSITIVLHVNHLIWDKSFPNTITIINYCRCTSICFTMRSRKKFNLMRKSASHFVKFFLSVFENQNARTHIPLQ